MVVQFYLAPDLVVTKPKGLYTIKYNILIAGTKRFCVFVPTELIRLGIRGKNIKTFIYYWQQYIIVPMKRLNWCGWHLGKGS